MNLSLVDPFVLAQDYPDTLTEKLSQFSLHCYTQYQAYFFQEAAMQLVSGSIIPATTWHPDEFVHTANWREIERKERYI